MMPIRRLSLSHFRNHADARLSVEPGFVILTGENGAGKTNILEAISLLAPGRGLRRAAYRDMAQDGGPGGFGIAADLGDVTTDSVTLGTGTLPTAPDRRQVRINGANAPATALAEWLSVLWLTPAMDRIFLEGASGRRRFLDRMALALFPTHATHAARYEAAMRARTRLLTDERPADPGWLSALEAQMREHGEALHRARADLVDLLAEPLAAAPEGPFARPVIALLPGYDPAVPLDGQLKEYRRRDVAAGRALVGPHRADLAVRHRTKDQPAERCSTGEQKALLLSLVLAHAALVRRRAGRPLVLLLDEIAAHLDPDRRAALFTMLRESAGQIWMTGTEPALFEAVPGPAKRFILADGQVVSVD